MRIKTTLVAASALALAAVSATAGGYEAPVVEAPVIVEEAAGSSVGSMGGMTPLLIGLGVLAVAAALADDGDH